MKEPDMERLATDHGPESCGGVREDAAEALDRGKHRPAIELRNHPSGAPTTCCDREGNTPCGANASHATAPRSQRP